MKNPIFKGDYSFNTGNVKTFSIVDHLIISVFLIICIAIGVKEGWQESKKQNMKDFLLGSKPSGVILVSFSLLASFMSGITIMGVPVEIYRHTTMYMWLGVAYFLTIAASAHIYVPVFYRLKVTTSYEYLEKRFSRGLRTVASVLFIFQMICYMSVVLYAPSIAINAVSGFMIWGSVLVMGAVCTAYTAFGGMKAVMWADCFQLVVMILSQIIIVVKGALVVGDMKTVWESGRRTHRILFTDFRVNLNVRHSVWSLVFGGYFTWVAIYGCNQVQIQRALLCSTLKKSQISVWLNFPGLFIILLLGCIIGLYMSAFYENCDPIKYGFVTEFPQMLPFFVMDLTNKKDGLPGILLAGVFSGALSTLSSGLNSVVVVFMSDIMKMKLMRKGTSQSKSQAYLAVFSAGVVSLMLTYVVSKVESILETALSLFGLMAGPLLGVFSLGMFFPWANVWGAYAGLISSIIAVFSLAMEADLSQFSRKTPNTIENCNFKVFSNETVITVMKSSIYVSQMEEEYTRTVSYIWYSAAAVIVSIVVGLIISFVTGPNKPKNLDAKLFCPLFDVCFPFLPEVVRKPLRFGIDFSRIDGEIQSQSQLSEPNALDGEIQPSQPNGANALEIQKSIHVSSLTPTHYQELYKTDSRLKQAQTTAQVLSQSASAFKYQNGLKRNSLPEVKHEKIFCTDTEADRSQTSFSRKKSLF